MVEKEGICTVGGAGGIRVWHVDFEAGADAKMRCAPPFHLCLRFPRSRADEDNFIIIVVVVARVWNRKVMRGRWRWWTRSGSGDEN
jgi:hypothetical protein